MTITAVILTKNNQTTLQRLITSLSWCHEIIVIDDQSTDNTIKLAKQSGARVLSRSLRHNFAAQRNFGLKQVRTDWVLFIDSDEIVTPPLAREIKSTITTSIYSAYSLRRLDIFLGKKLRFGETGHINLLRLARINAGRWHRPVHEIWRIKGSVGQLKSPLYHSPHPTLAGFFNKINHYTDIEAGYRRRQFDLFELIFYPPGKFFYNYFIKLGFLDGIPGLIMAVMMSLHSLLVRIKLYEKSILGPASRPSSN